MGFRRLTGGDRWLRIRSAFHHQVDWHAQPADRGMLSKTILVALKMVQ